MSTQFSVTVGDDNYTVWVAQDDFRAVSIILLECLIHYREMERIDAIIYYQHGDKEVREGSITMGDVSVKLIEDEQPKFTDLMVFPPTTSDENIEYWQDYGNNA